MTRVHLIGIGGAGMSAIARVLAERGDDVDGCDRSAAGGAALADLDVRCAVGHDPAHLEAGMLVGVSGAIPADEPELVEARRRGLEVRHRAELLARIVEAGSGICVAGTHGKTTVAAMLAFVLDAVGASPTFVVGGDVPQLGASARAGSGPFVVAEADESDGSLLELRPRCAIVLNLEHDHQDNFPSFEALRDVFATWAARLPSDGVLVAGDGIDLAGAAPTARFGLGPGEGWRAHDAVSEGRSVRFRLQTPSGGSHDVVLQVPGLHNAANATACLAALDWAGVPLEQAIRELGRFGGAGRRFEERGEPGGVRLVDDYAHHPSEIAATLAAGRGYAGRGRLLACMKPLMPFRARVMQREFADALAAADAVCICEVLVARGAPEPGVSAKLIVDRLSERAPWLPLAWTPQEEDAARWLAARARPGDVVMTLGPRPVDRVCDLLRERLA